LSEGQRAIAVVAATATVGDDADVRLCIIVVIVLVMTVIPPPLTAVKGVLPASRLPERHDDPPWKIVAIISTRLV